MLVKIIDYRFYFLDAGLDELHAAEMTSFAACNSFAPGFSHF